MNMIRLYRLRTRLMVLFLVLLCGAIFVSIPAVHAVENPQSGSVGLQGKIPSPPPTQGATISIPRDGQLFTTIPVTVSGICPNDLLVKLFKNGVFAGSQQCTKGSFSIAIDLFSGKNDLIARVYDALDQAGPDSNTVSVTYNDIRGPGATPHVTLTSIYAKRGANPGQALTWPVQISGGVGPYAMSIDWGDGKQPELKSVQYPGTVTLSHTYDSPGVYNIIIKATDKDGISAFLQLVGIGNGPLSQTNNADNASSDKNGANGAKKVAPDLKYVWILSAILFPLIGSTFWLGRHYELVALRKKLEKINNQTE